jgi:hypothetical protein
MKNKVLLLAAVITLGISANAFATAGTPTWLTKAADGSFAFPVGTTITPLTVKPSANVWISYAVETTGAAYSLATLHSTGTFTYSTTSTDTNIYRFANTSQSCALTTGAYNGAGQAALSSPPDAVSTISWGAGWTASK